MVDQSAAAPAPLPAPGPESSPRPLTRRDLLLGAGAAGAALVSTNAITGVVAHRAASRAAQARAQERIGQLDAEIRQLKLQLALYQELDRVGLDDLIKGILDVYDRLWPPVRKGLGLLLEGLQGVETALNQFELGLPTLRSAAQLLHDLLATVESQVQGVEEITHAILKRAAPVGQAVSSFLNWLISKIPFGVGAQVLEAADRVGDLMAAVPALIADVRLRLLGPLEGDWLPAEEGQGLQGRLLKPLRDGLLTPLRSHLDEVTRLADGWDKEVAGPLRSALAQRERIRGKLGRAEQAREPLLERI